MAHAQIKGQRKGLEIFNIGNREYYKLYDTVIVISESTEEGYNIRLNHGGFKTNHTKNCMNDFLRRFGFKVYQKNFEWYVKGAEIPFSFDMECAFFKAIPNWNKEHGYVIGQYIVNKFKPFTVTTWYDNFCFGNYSPTLK